MNFKQTSYFFSLISGVIFTVLATSCGSSEPVNVEVGKEFEIDGKKLKVEKIKASTVLSNDEQKVSIVAPEGKKYVYFELSNPEDKMVFIKAKSNGEDVKMVDDMRLGLDFSHEVGDGYQDAYFLIGENDDIEFSITTPSDDVYKVNKTDLKIENDREILPEMRELVSKYSSSINLLKPLEPYVEGKPISIAKTKDGSMVTSPLTENMTIKYIFPDGKKYVASTEGLFSTTSEITWENGKITSFMFGFD